MHAMRASAADHTDSFKSRVRMVLMVKVMKVEINFQDECRSQWKCAEPAAAESARG
jgi:hypothetical protein